MQLQSDNQNIKFKHPEEGFMVFTDNMQVPVGAPHAYTAEKFMDFVYEPEVAAQIDGVRELRAAGEGHQGGPREERPEASPRTR